ncbi:ABC transporter substrate-binding protein [Actinospongicola halichondriae]|uniref:ABC transporter substrate-binding protein n=1 Tax=Actinospongicola halichondriae TaxID=3236844 RepID=UPI003D38B076
MRNGSRSAKKLRLLAILAVGASLVAACAAGDEEEGAPNPTESPGDALPTITDSRFTSTEQFCTPAVEDPEGTPEASAPGITEDAVVITNLRLMTEQLEEIGYAYDSGDTIDQIETFVRIVNEECGGINGRQLQLENLEQSVPGFGDVDPALEAQAGCTTVAEDHQSAIAFSHTGVALPLAACLTEQHDVVYLSVYDLAASDFASADGRLFSVVHSPADVLSFAAHEFADEIEGKRVGVVHGDDVPVPETVQVGLLDTLADLGIEVTRHDVLSCGDDPFCSDGVIDSARAMVNDDIEVIFPLINPGAMPGYISELVTQGAEPGDIEFFTSSFQTGDSELSAGYIVSMGSEDAGRLYDGAQIISHSRAGEHRLEDFEVRPFVEMCHQQYIEHSSVVTEPYDILDDEQNRILSNVSYACMMVRLVARTVEAAGVNPTRADLAAAMGNLGEIDHPEGPASFTPGKFTAPDAIVRSSFRYPCPVDVNNEVGHCILPDSDFLPLPG